MRKLIDLRLIALLLLLQISPAQTFSTFHGEAQAVQEQMTALRAAELTYDSKAASGLLADGFMLTTPEGKLFTKRQFLQIVEDSKNPLELLQYGEMDIRIYGDVAVVFVQIHEKGTLDGQRYEINGRPTYTWIHQHGKWTCIAAHD